MASQAKLKTFTVIKRFSVYVDIDVKAESMQRAVEIREGLNLADLIKPAKAAQFVDWKTLPGGGVYESDSTD